MFVVAEMQGSFDAVLLSTPECCLIRSSCDISFQKRFTCAFLLLPTLSAFTTKFPLSVPSHARSHSLTHSPNLRAVQTPLACSLQIMEKNKIDFLKKGREVHVTNFVFSSTFSSPRSPHSCLLSFP